MPFRKPEFLWYASILKIDLPANGTLAINGKWTPNYTVDIRKGELLMGEGSQIEMGSLRTFIIQGTKVHACNEKLWRGITVLHYGSIRTNAWVGQTTTYLPEIYRSKSGSGKSKL